MSRALLAGVFSGTVGLMGLLLCNGLLACGGAWAGEGSAILLAGILAGLATQAASPAPPPEDPAAGPAASPASPPEASPASPSPAPSSPAPPPEDPSAGTAASPASPSEASPASPSPAPSSAAPSLRAAVLWAGLVTGLVAWCGAGPNPSLEVEYGIDRFLLLPQLAGHLAGPPPWQGSPVVLASALVTWLAGHGGLPGLLGQAGLAFVAISAALVGALVSWIARAHRPRLARCVLVVVVASFLVSAAHMNPGIHAYTERPPVPHEYTMDGFLYLRVHDLMQSGTACYPAVYMAYVQRRGETGTPGNWLNWRPPTLYFLWNPIPGGPRGLVIAFWVLAALSLVAAFGFARTGVDEGVALLAPVLLGAYFLYGAVTPWFPSQEYWAAFFMLLGAWGHARGHFGTGAVLWVLAATSREHFLFLVPLLLLLGAWGSRRERLASLAALLGVFALYAAHYAEVARFVQPGNPGLRPWTEAGFTWVWRCLQFGSVYVALRAPLFPFLVAAGLVGSFAARDRRLRAMGAGMVVMPLVALLFIGAPDRFYWGVVLVPQILLCVPLLLSRACPPSPPRSRQG